MYIFILDNRNKRKNHGRVESKTARRLTASDNTNKKKIYIYMYLYIMYII